MKSDVTVIRLRAQLDRYAQAYHAPQRPIWARLIDTHLATPGQRPAWCFLTMREFSEIQLDVLRDNGMPDEQMTPQLAQGIVRDLSALSALGTWQVTRGIYRLDHTLLAELWDTPLTGDLPAEVLLRLPEWCVYVETPVGATHLGLELRGYWAHLDPDPRGFELRLLPDLAPMPGDAQGPWLPLGIPLGGTLDEAMNTYFSSADVPHEWYAWARGAVSVLLYLCSASAEYAEPRPQAVTGQQLRRARHPQGRDVPAYVIGRTLGQAIRAARSAPAAMGGHGGEKRPHWRSARWTTVWTGKGKAVPEARWEPGLLVRADRLGEGEQPVVIHPVI